MLWNVVLLMSLKYKPSYATILFLKSPSDENLVWRHNYLCIPVSADLLFFYSFKSSIWWNLLGNYEHRRCLKCLQLIIILLDSYWSSKCLLYIFFTIKKKKNTYLSIPQRQTHTANFGLRENTLNIFFSSLWCQKKGKTTAVVLYQYLLKLNISFFLF